MTWHAEAGVLREYQAGTLGPAQAASIDTHLMACPDCRSVLGTMADPDRVARIWSTVEDRISAPHRSWLERSLVRAGISERRVRLIVLTPTLRSPALVGVLAVFMAVLLLNVAGHNRHVGDLYLFLVLAPVLPLAGVAAAFNPGSDPAHEIVAATPTTPFEILLTRSIAIVATTTGITMAASLALPHSWHAAAWLLPSLALSIVCLALSSWIPMVWTASALATAWVATAAVSWQVNRFEPDVIGRFVALRPSGQLVFATITVVGALVVVVRRHAFDLGRMA